MRSFFILYKTGFTLEGKTKCSKKDFEENVIKPMSALVYSWNVWDSILELDIDLINELV